MAAIAKPEARTMRRVAQLRLRAWAVALSVLATGAPTAAFAYRPFDSTDAAVVERGQLEVELGPAQYLRDGGARTLVAPAVALNYGLASRWEAVLEGQLAHGLTSDVKGTSVDGNGLFLKYVVREGSLQDKSGPSLATEFGVLLPGIDAEPGAGVSAAGIVSQQWSNLTLHLNVQGALTREGRGDVFVGAIVEGPHAWTVRPVAELSYEREFGRSETVSVLAGAIWQIRENLAVDVGIRRAHVDDHMVDEIRAGLTFSFSPRL